MGELLVNGLLTLVTSYALLAAFLGVLIGIAAGAIPGIGPSMTLAILLPFTFGIGPTNGLLLLVGAYAGCVYGGSISGILLGIPGEPASIPTTWEGSAMARQGKAIRALRLAVTASTIGGTFSALALLFLSPVIAEFALRFGPPEYVALCILGLGAVASLGSASPLKGAIAAFMGLLIGTVGMDPAHGFFRFTFHEPDLYQGFALVPILIGIFALPELVDMVKGNPPVSASDPSLKRRRQVRLQDIRTHAKPIARGTAIGMAIGALPGAGGTVATFIAYDDAKRHSKHPERFSKGAEDGLMAAESCANGSVQTALIPLLTLGIPGSAAAAVFLGGLTIHGLQPGPLLYTKQAAIIYPFLLGALVLQAWLYLSGRVAAPLFARIAQVRVSVLVPCIVVLATLGTYAIGNNIFDVWVMLGSGILGVLMERFGISRAAFVLAIILGPLLEGNVVRSLDMSGGSPGIFVARPISAAIYVLMIAVLVAPKVTGWLRSKYGRVNSAKTSSSHNDGRASEAERERQSR